MGFSLNTHVRFFMPEQKGQSMKDRDFKRHIAYEVLVILGMLALLLFICRLWPILLLVILGIFIAAIRLLFLSRNKVEVILPMSVPEEKEQKEPTEKDVQDLAFHVAQRRITDLLAESYPAARWVWKTPQAKQRILAGEDTFILLNHAGGYREAKVRLVNLRVTGLEFTQTQNAEQPDPDETEPEEQAKETPPNYEYLAFEWVDTHAVELNERCNECIAQGMESLLIGAAQLPARESWPDICRELGRNGMEECECVDAGIYIHLTQKTVERNHAI